MQYATRFDQSSPPPSRRLGHDDRLRWPVTCILVAHRADAIAGWTTGFFLHSDPKGASPRNIAGASLWRVLRAPSSAPRVGLSLPTGSRPSLWSGCPIGFAKPTFGRSQPSIPAQGKMDRPCHARPWRDLPAGGVRFYNRERRVSVCITRRRSRWLRPSIRQAMRRRGSSSRGAPQVVLD